MEWQDPERDGHGPSGRRRPVRMPGGFHLPINVPLLLGGFLLAMVVIAIAGSVGTRDESRASLDYWQQFNALPAEGLGESVIVGTWRGDVRGPRDPAEAGPDHCGIRTYGLPFDAGAVFLQAVDTGQAAGWRPGADVAGPRPGILDTERDFCGASDRLMRAMREKIATAWGDPANPRFGPPTPPSPAPDIHGVYDRTTRQAHVWFTARDEAPAP